MDNQLGDIIVYQSEDGLTHVDVRFEGDTVWLSKSQIADLFQRDRTNIGRHISNIFAEQELDEKSNVQKMHVPNSDRPVEYYSLSENHSGRGKGGKSGRTKEPTEVSAHDQL